MSVSCCRRPCRGQFRHAVQMAGRSACEGVPSWRERLLAWFRANIGAWAGVRDGQKKQVKPSITFKRGTRSHGDAC